MPRGGWKYRITQAKGMAGVETFKAEVASGSYWERIVDKNELKGE